MAEQNLMQERLGLANWEEYLELDVNPQTYQDWIDSPLGGWETKQAAHVDLPKLLEAYKRFLIKKGIYQEKALFYEDLQFEHEKVYWKEIVADKLIFCEGIASIQNPFFNWLPFKAVKGEILDVEIKGNHLENIINQGIFILANQSDSFRVGATYHYQSLDAQITEEGRQELSQKLDKMLKLPYRITGQKGGIRPATRDRRPFIGLHPDYKQLGIFGGMGAKGVSLCPYYANHFYEHIELGKPLDKEVNIMRAAKTNHKH